MPELDPLDSAIDEVAGAREASAPPDALDSAIDHVAKRDKQTSDFRQSVYGALPTKPDAYARAKALQKTTGVPVETIERNMDEVERNTRVDTLVSLVNDAPVLRARMRDRDFALQTHDDAERLRDVELAADQFGRRLKTEDDFKRMAAFPAAFAPKRTLGDQAVTTARAAASTIPRISKAGYTGLAAVLGLGREAMDLFSGPNAKFPLLPTNPLAPLEDMAKYAAGTQESLVQQVQGELPADASIAEQGVRAGVESFAQQAELLTAAIAARNPMLVLPAMSAVTGAESYYKAAIENKLPPSQAAVYGMADAQVEYWTEKVPIERLFGDVGAGKGLMKTAMRQLAVELPMEQVATIGQDFNEWVFVNPQKTLQDYINERPSAAAVTLVATIVGTAGNIATTTAIDKFTRDGSRAKRATEHAELLADLMKMAEASATHERTPETFQQFLQQAAAETDDLHIDANVLLQEVGPEKIAQLMPSVVPQLATAVASGGTVNIPLAEAVSGLAGSGLEEKLLPHFKTSPNAMSQAEAETYLQTEGERLKQETQKILAETEDRDAFAQSAQKVHDAFLGELKSTNRFRAEVNENYAQLVSSFYTVLAGRMGVTPEEMYARYPLRVRAEETQGDEVLTHEQSSLLDARVNDAIGKLAVGTTIIESRDRDGYRIARKEGGGYVITPVGDQSRIKKREVDEAGARQFLAEQYGSLLLEQKVFHGSPHKFERFSLDKVGTGEGAQAYGWGLYFAENPGVAHTYAPLAFDVVQGRALNDAETDAFPKGMRALIDNKGDIEAAKASLHKQRAVWARKLTDKDPDEVRAAKMQTQWYDDALALFDTGGYKVKQGQGAVYHAEVPDSAVERMLDWDKPLSEQPKALLQAIKSEGLEWSRAADGTPSGSPDLKRPERRNGQDVYHALSKHLGGDKQASEFLASIGIPGIKYLDQGSRDAGKGTRNFVVFDPKVVDEINSSMEQRVLDQSAKSQTSTPEFKRWFGDSKVVDANGEPLVVYHGTDKDFDAFKRRPGDVGMHFGTAGQAEDRLNYGRERGVRSEEGLRTVPVYLSIKNPLRLPDLGLWDYDNLGFGVVKAGALTKEEWRAARTAAGVRKALQRKGYDGIVYKNTGETAGAGPLRAVRDAAFKNMIAAQKARGKPGNAYDFEDRQTAEYKAFAEADAAYAGFREQNAEDSYIAFEREQIKSAIGNRGTFDPNDANILNQTSPSGNDLGFFSMALKVAESFPPKQSASAQQWTKTLLNKGVKQEEIEWLGLDELRVKKMSRDELIEYIRANELQVEETALDGEPDSDDEYAIDREVQRRVDEIVNDRLEGFEPEFDGAYVEQVESDEDEDGVAWLVRASGGGEWDTYPSEELALEAVDEINAQIRYDLVAQYETDIRNEIDEEEIESEIREERGAGKNGPRYADSSYVLPGGENHVELVLSLPPIERSAEPRDTSAWRAERTEAMGSQRAYFRVYDEQGDVYVSYEKVGPIKDEETALAYARNEVEKRTSVRSENQIDPYAEEDDTHYGDIGEGTAVAWIRANDRVGPNGERIFFIEEIQSKRHQEGKKRGYRSEAEAAIQKRREELRAELKEADRERYAAFDARQAALDRRGTSAAVVDITELNARLDAAVERVVAIDRKLTDLDRTAGVGTVPDAPFKKTWPELALKRAIRYAAERGYDQIAWTTGAQQAERYQLGGRVRRIRYVPEGGQLEVATTTDGSFILKDNVSPEQLPEFIGEELTARLLATPPEGQLVPSHTLTGGDVFIGGEGMKAFYDRQLVDTANKLGKKYGARAGTIDIRANQTVSREHREYGYESGLPRVPTPVHALPLTDALKAAALGPGFPLFQKARGQIAFGGDMTAAPSVISLFKDADLSTFLHEAGHFFLQVYVDVASRPDAPPTIQADLNAFFEWTGVKNLTEWQSMSFEQKRAHHEKFARGFETYLFEGKSPSPQMRGLFERFKAWMLNVYRHLTALDADLNPEMRGLFDRMLATDEQIEQAEAERNYEALFTTPPKGMDQNGWAEYQALGLEATADAKRALEKRALRDMRWLSNMKSRELRRLKRDVAAKRKAERVLAAEEVRQQQVYAVQHFLRTGEAPLEVTGRLELGGSHKLDLDALKLEYPDGQVGLDNPHPLADLGRMAGKDGLPPATVAQLFGYTSTDHMLKDILAAPAEKEAVEALADQRVLEKYGDITSPDALERAAEAAIHNETRARFLETEVNALADATGSPKILRKAAKAFAEASLAKRKVKDIRPAPYEAAEAKAGKAAMDAMTSGDLELAAVQKRNQLVNHYGQRAATAAQDEVERSVRYLKKVVDSEKIDVEYRDQIAALLDRVELRRITQKEAKRRSSLLEWVEAQREAGIEPLIDDALLNEALRQPHTEMTLEEFRGLVDAVKNIEHIGRLKKKLLTSAKQKQLDAAAEEIAAGIEQHSPGRKPVKVEKTAADRTLDGIDAFFASHRKASSLARVMDGQRDGGPVWQYIIRGLNAAGDKEATLREQATTKLAKLLEGDAGKDFAKQVYIPEIGTSLSREARIVIALNTGNEGNLQRLQDGEGWTDAQVKAVVDTLSPEDITLVNSIFAFLEGYRDAIGAKEKRVSGVEPEWVQGTPFEAKGGLIKGGYFPIKYDPDRSSRAESDTLAETIRQTMQGAYTRATTRRGHTKARAEKVKNRPVRKDLGVLFEHTSQVIHDLAFHEYLIDANRLLRHPLVDAAIREHHGPEVLRQLKSLINDVAAGDLASETAFERAINHIRTGATVAGLGWNLTTSLLQPLGLTQSMVRIGPQWVGRGLSRWMRDAATMENTAAWIQSKSEFMRLRGKTMQREINEIRNKVSGKESAIEASFFYLIQKMQMVADIPTWLGQYEKAMASGVDEAEAVAQADQAVIDSQAAGQIKDLAQVQRGGPLLKLFTNFYSFFSTTYNQMAEVKARTNLRDPLSVGRAAADYMLLITVPAVLSMMLKDAMSGGGDDDDDFWTRAAKAQLSYLMGVMLGLRDLGQVIQGYDYKGPAGLRAFQELSRLYKQAEQGELDEAALKALNAAMGVLFHYPAGQVERTVTGAIALIEDDTDNPLALVAGKPKN